MHKMNGDDVTFEVVAAKDTPKPHHKWRRLLETLIDQTGEKRPEDYPAIRLKWKDYASTSLSLRSTIFNQARAMGMSIKTMVDGDYLYLKLADASEKAGNVSASAGPGYNVHETVPTV